MISVWIFMPACIMLLATGQITLLACYADVYSGALAIWSARGVYTMQLYLHYLITRGSSVTTPYFHLAERDQPLVVQQDVPVAKQLLMVVAVGQLIWLFTRFTFGRASRSYYGFDKMKKV